MQTNPAVEQKTQL